MQVKIISYEKVFPIAQYQNEKIGVQVQVDEGESPEEVLEKAKEIVEGFHKSKYPHLYVDQQIQVIDAPTYKMLEPQIIPDKSKKQSTEDKIIEQIRLSSEIKVLETFKMLARRKPELQAAYDERLKQLENQ